MKVAIIYFPISSVGGIATVARNLQRAARASKDEAHVLRSSDATTIQPGLFASPKRIRGGDSHIVIDGEAPHGARFRDTKKFLEENYDALFFVHPCCHPTKAYGTEARWLDMYSDIQLPKAMRFSDGYAETYPWVKSAIGYCEAVFAVEKAYTLPLEKLGIKAEILPHPFFPEKEDAPRAKTRLTVYPNQWKQIKCPWEFVAALPKIKGTVEMLNNGIEYYNIRTDPTWIHGVGVDLFAEPKEYAGQALAGPRTRRFHGSIPYLDAIRWYQRAWSIVDLMGQRAKHGAYREGAFNNTVLEALWYGARPILHVQALKARLPHDLSLHIDLGPKHKNLAPLIECVNAAQPLSPKELDRARTFVLQHHDAKKVWKQLKGALT